MTDAAMPAPPVAHRKKRAFLSPLNQRRCQRAKSPYCTGSAGRSSPEVSRPPAL